MARVWPPQGDDSPSFAFKSPCCCTVAAVIAGTFEWRATSQIGEGVCRCTGYFESDCSDAEDPFPLSPEDAIARMIAADEWSIWFEADPVLDGGPSFYETPPEHEPCFSYWQGQWRASYAGLVPSTSYDVSLEYWRAIYDTPPVPPDAGDFSFLASVIVTAVSDGSGNLVLDPVNIPNAAGFYTIAKASTLGIALT